MIKKLIAFSAALTMIIPAMQLNSFAAGSNANVYDGYASLKFVNSQDSPYKMFSQSNITVEPNTEYTAQIWVKGNKCAKLRILDSSDWGDLDTKVEKTLSGSGDEWVKNEVTFNTGSAEKITFTIATDTYNRGTAYFDSAALYKSGSDENILINPSMEDDGYKWGSWTEPFFMEESQYLMSEGELVAGNIEKPSPAPSDAPTQDPVSKYNVYDGYTSMKFVNAQDSPYKMFSQSNIAVESNTEYTAQIWVKGNKCAKLRILDSSDWGDLDTKVEKTLSGNGDEWVKNEVTFNTGSAEKITFTIATDTYNRGTAYFDSAAIYKSGSEENILSNPSMEDDGYKWGSWTEPFFMEKSSTMMENGVPAVPDPEEPVITMNGSPIDQLSSGTIDISISGTDGVLIAALYRDGLLQKCSAIQSKNGSASTSIEVSDSDTELKVMVWENIDSSLTPITKAVTLN